MHSHSVLQNEVREMWNSTLKRILATVGIHEKAWRPPSSQVYLRTMITMVLGTQKKFLSVSITKKGPLYEGAKGEIPEMGVQSLMSPGMLTFSWD